MGEGEDGNQYIGKADASQDKPCSTEDLDSATVGIIQSLPFDRWDERMRLVEQFKDVSRSQVRPSDHNLFLSACFTTYLNSGNRDRAEEVYRQTAEWLDRNPVSQEEDEPPQESENLHDENSTRKDGHPVGL